MVQKRFARFEMDDAPLEPVYLQPTEQQQVEIMDWDIEIEALCWLIIALLVLGRQRNSR
jgi:hypothetical protein